MNLKALIPKAVKSKVKAGYYRWRLSRTVRAMRKGDLSRKRLEDLQRYWGNPGWSADVEYLQHVCRYAQQTQGVILECGSGATTILLGLISDQVWSLEHHPGWFDQVRRTLKQLRIRNRLTLAPLAQYPGFDWYDVSGLNLPSISLVVCDGPPGETKGGRLGLIPALQDRLRGATVLLDDADRPAEQEVLERWRAQYGCQVELLRGIHGGMAVVHVPEDTA